VDTEAQAKKVRAELRTGADFSVMAGKYSQDQATAARGGDLGYIERGESLPEFERVAFGLKQGAVSDPVRTGHGWHILKVSGSRKGGYKDYDEVKRLARLGVLKGKRENAMKDFVERLRRDARIEQHPDMLKDLK
jgi:peptidyl-prolyl cis-trans isomerase C